MDVNVEGFYKSNKVELRQNKKITYHRNLCVVSNRLKMILLCLDSGNVKQKNMFTACDVDESLLYSLIYSHIPTHFNAFNG